MGIDVGAQFARHAAVFLALVVERGIVDLDGVAAAALRRIHRRVGPPQEFLGIESRCPWAGGRQFRR